MIQSRNPVMMVSLLIGTLENAVKLWKINVDVWEIK
jgi:hypothetical protein